MGSFDRRELAAVFAGGIVGALARLALVECLPHGAVEWPWSTFVANLIGAFALGWFAAALWERDDGSAFAHRSLLGAGFCGTLTTFSTMQLELVRILEVGDASLAIAYATTSIVAGMAAVTAGSSLGRRREAA